MAVLLELAHLLSQFVYAHELRFIAFDAEEIGLFGSRHHGERARKSGKTNVEVSNVDRMEVLVMPLTAH